MKSITWTLDLKKKASRAEKIKKSNITMRN